MKTYDFAKRGFDVIVSLFVLLLFSPLLFFVAFKIKNYDGGPIFYRGERVGQAGRLFKIFKFRSMVTNAEQLGGTSTSGNDPRITPIGHFVRKFKIDELPQFINVLLGDMSIVGPRPQVAWAVNTYSDKEKKVLELRPGITDWASIEFSNEEEILRGAEDADKAYMELIHPHKMKLALKYHENYSLLTDLSIIFKTISCVIRKV